MHLANKLFFLICTLFVVCFTDQTTNAGKLSKFVNRMHSLSRLVNGIVLEAGLISGSIPSDDVISEFIHIGKLSIDDVMKIDAVKMNTSVSTLEILQGNLSSSTEIDAVEARFLILENIRKMSLNIGDVENLPGNDIYQNALKQIENVNIDLNSQSKIFGNLKEIQNNIDMVNKMTVNDTETGDGDKKMVEIQKVIGSFETFEKDVKEFQAILIEIKKLESFQNIDTSFLDPLYEEEKVRKEYDKETSGGSKIQLNVINDNIEQIQKSSTIFKNSKDAFSPLQSLISIRIDSLLWTNKYSSGFSEGFKSLQSLSKDSINPDLKFLFSKTESEWVSQHLLRAISPMTEFGKNVTDFDSKWASFSSKPSLDSIDYVAKTQNDISKHADNQDIQKRIFQKFEDCDKFSMDPNVKIPSINTIDDVKTATTELQNAIAKLKTFDYLKNLSDFKQLKKLKKVKTITEDQLISLKKLKIFPETNSLLTSLESDFTEFNAILAKIQGLIVKSKYSNIEQYSKTLKASKYLDFYSCLTTGIGTDGNHVLEVLKTIHEVRKDGKNVKTKEALAVVEQFSSSSKDLKILKTSGEEMKKIVEEEVIVLKNSMFDKSLEINDKLANSVKGLDQIQTVSENQIGLESLLRNVSFVMVAAEKEKSKLKPTDYQELLKIEKLKQTLEKMYSEIDTLENSITNSNPTDFSSFIPVFTEANKIPEVTEDVTLMKTALNSLATIDPALQVKITEILNSLSNLETLDMKYSKYNIENGNDSLKALDLFFTNFGGKIPAPPTIPPTPTVSIQISSQKTSPFGNDNQLGITMKQTINTTEWTMPEWQIGIIAIVCLFVAAIVILGILSYCRGWFCFKTRKLKSTSSLVDVEPTVILPPLPPVHAAESLYIPPPSMYQQIPIPPPPPPTIGQPKKETGISGNAQLGSQDFPQATITVEPTQENEINPQTLEEVGDVKSKEGVKSKEPVLKGTKSTSKEETKMKPSHEVM